MTDQQLKWLIRRIAEMHVQPEGDWAVWRCGPHVFRRPIASPDFWEIDGKPLADMTWEKLLKVAGMIADCAWV